MAAGIVRTETRFLNRELSQLDFNGRVLEVAADESVPLLDRVNFCSIFSANTDEFFMVRVAGLMDQVAAGVTRRSSDGLTPRDALFEVRRRSRQLAYDQTKLWKWMLKPALAAEGIVVAEIEDLESDVFPVLTPLAVGPGQSFPYISGLFLSLGLVVPDDETGSAFESIMEDTRWSWALRSDGTWERAQGKGQRRPESPRALMRRARARARRAGGVSRPR